MQELSKLLLTEMDFNGALATITFMDVTAKLDHAKVGISVIPRKNEQMVLKALKNILLSIK